jgi:hypothetical protein
MNRGAGPYERRVRVRRKGGMSGARVVIHASTAPGMVVGCSRRILVFRALFVSISGRAYRGCLRCWCRYSLRARCRVEVMEESDVQRRAEATSLMQYSRRSPRPRFKWLPLVIHDTKALLSFTTDRRQFVGFLFHLTGMCESDFKTMSCRSFTIQRTTHCENVVSFQKL